MLPQGRHIRYDAVPFLESTVAESRCDHFVEDKNCLQPGRFVAQELQEGDVSGDHSTCRLHGFDEDGADVGSEFCFCIRDVVVVCDDEFVGKIEGGVSAEGERAAVIAVFEDEYLGTF